MNDFLELFPIPAERDLPYGRLEHHKAALLQRVDADLRTRGRRAGRLRGLLAWLTSLGIMLALIGVAGSTLLTTHFRAQGTRAAVEAVTLESAPVAASLLLARKAQVLRFQWSGSMPPTPTRIELVHEV
jgi:hypothetical protein